MTFPWDELNVIRSRVETLEIEDTEEPGKKKFDAEKVIDIVYEYLEMAWTMGVENVNENMSTSFSAESADMSAKMREEIDRRTAGRNYKERIREYAETGDLEAIMRVADTDAHRILNSAAMTTAKKASAKYKTWVTMQDDRVRDTHEPLQAITIGIDDYFVTYDGDRALMPGGFEKPENVINCRCICTFA